jgi:hypothetical protein
MWRVEIRRGERAAPDAAGIQPEHTVRGVQSEGRPVAEDDALAAAGALRDPVPR